ncbi:hypothetical protein C3B79_1812 [Aeromonas hydrophila]|nr:hypothetical protein C3B79_1812 [Aeromonas hydrophila]
MLLPQPLAPIRPSRSPARMPSSRWSNNGRCPALICREWVLIRVVMLLLS